MANTSTNNLIVPVVLARVSSDDQSDRGTIQNQIEFAKKYADLHGFDIKDWYLDDGISGVIPLDQRPEGKRLLDDAKAGKFNLVLIYKLDRLGRSARIILNAVHELESYGIKVRSMTEPFDTGDPAGRFTLTILAGVADLERETILQRLWHGANRVARTGKWLGGITPYGYHVNQEGFLEITETPLPDLELSEADVIRMIYRLTVDQDYTCCEIADYFNALGIPPSYVKDKRLVMRGKRKVATAGKWRPGRIRNMIVNETYKGIHHYGKRTKKEREIITRKVPAIVSEETWEQAQQALKNHRLESIGNSKRQYLLRGLIKCGICGLTFCGTVYWSKSRGVRKKYKAVYRCNGKTKYRGPFDGECTSKNIPADWLEDIVWNKVIELSNNPKGLKEFLTANQEKQDDNLEYELELLNKTIAGKDAERSAILDLFRKKIISQVEVESQLNKINIEKEQLVSKAQEIKKMITNKKEISDRTSEAEILLESIRNRLNNDITFEEKREIIKSLISHIKIEYKEEQGKIEIIPHIHLLFLKS